MAHLGDPLSCGVAHLRLSNGVSRPSVAGARNEAGPLERDQVFLQRLGRHASRVRELVHGERPSIVGDLTQNVSAAPVRQGTEHGIELLVTESRSLH